MSPASADIEIVGGERLADLTALEPVARAIFGAGRRQPGWFARKLLREGVEPSLCALAVAVGETPTPSSVLGYALLSRPPSLATTARGAGVGLLPDERGQGVGPRLLAFASDRARAAGCERLELLAETVRLPWYRRIGFTVAREELTLLAPDSDAGAWPQAGSQRERLAWQPCPDPALGRDPLWSWLPECWQRTPDDQRRVVQVQWQDRRLRAWLSREGRAWLVQRFEIDGGADSSTPDPELLAQAIASLRSLDPRAPWLLYPCPALAPWVTALSWPVAQRSFVVARPTAR